MNYITPDERCKRELDKEKKREAEAWEEYLKELRSLSPKVKPFAMWNIFLFKLYSYFYLIDGALPGDVVCCAWFHLLKEWVYSGEKRWNQMASEIGVSISYPLSSDNAFQDIITALDRKSMSEEELNQLTVQAVRRRSTVKHFSELNIWTPAIRERLDPQRQRVVEKVFLSNPN